MNLLDDRPTRSAAFDAANTQRTAQAAAITVARVTRALHILGPTAEPAEAAAARLRVEHPHASLTALSTIAGPPLTKDAIAGRLRQLLTHADRVARQRGIPGTAVDPAAVVAEALFCSNLSRHTTATTEQIHAAVENTLARFGLDGCVATVATAFGDHPHTAPARMCWCREATAVAYPGCTRTTCQPEGT